jgi:hypothetical protein
MPAMTMEIAAAVVRRVMKRMHPKYARRQGWGPSG